MPLASALTFLSQGRVKTVERYDGNMNNTDGRIFVGNKASENELVSGIWKSCWKINGNNCLKIFTERALKRENAYLYLSSVLAISVPAFVADYLAVTSTVLENVVR